MNFAHTLETISNWAVPMIVLFIPLYAICKGVKVYEVFVDGAKEGFSIGVTIMPYLVAILVAIGLMRDVRLLDVITQAIEPLTMLVYLPGEILPLALIRPLSGGGASGIMNAIMAEHGPDSYLGLMASVMMGSTETTFYVLAVYFGAVNIRATRHAVLAGLTADGAGILATAILCRLAFGDLL
ncbi:MAG: spore maturation protein [Candidatus Sumerlaeia bacterium]|nr:spore maturation protein [Candidatus Sumerlaeia bacterium]